MINNVIFDFDSTIINAEGIELIVETALQRVAEPERQKKLARLKEITATVTDGNMPFHDAFHQRFSLTLVTREDVQSVAEHIIETINPMVRESLETLRKHGKNIFIFSISFEELVRPVALELGIPEENVFANTMLVDEGDVVIGVDPNQPLFLNTGKVYLAERLKNEGRLNGDTAIVGDGYSDLLVRKNNLAKMFVYFSGSFLRPEVQKQADFTVDRFDQLLPLFCSNDEFSGEASDLLVSQEPSDMPEEKPHILLLENIHAHARQRFGRRGFEARTEKKALSEEELCALGNDIQILGIRSKTHLTAKTIGCLQELWAIGAFCIGTNQIDLVAAANAGIPVFNAPYSNTRSVAELVVGEIIMLMRRVPEKSAAAHQGQWLKSAEGCTEIRGKTVGIVGYGHIGSQVSILLENLGMFVIFHDIVDKLPLGNAKRARDLDDLLARADVVTLHVPDTPLTRGMIGAEQIRRMKPGSFLINCSRGTVVDLEALRQSILDRHIAGAAVDVFPEEPARPVDAFRAPLQNLPNVILTPHIGGSTKEAQENIANYVSEKLIQFVETGSTLGAVNFPEVDLPRVPGTHRILHVHTNVPGVLAKINNVFALRNINVAGQILQTKGNIGYLIVDVDSQISAQVISIMRHLTETIKVRRIT